MLFIDNKYLHLYYKIIEVAKLRKHTNFYTERHHINPRSLGGDNNPENLVKLSGREHYICHKLLTKMTTGKNQIKMIFALNCMMNRFNETMERYVPSSHQYEYLRIKLSESHKKLGRTPKHIEAIKKTHTGKFVSLETREKMSKSIKAAGPAGGSVKGSIRKKETRQKISQSRKGIVFSEEHKRKLSEAAKNRKKSGP